MKVHIRMTGCINRPVDGLDRWFHIYWLEAENGAVAQEYDEDIIEEGDYDLPDEDWTFDANKEYGEDLIDEQDILGRTTA